MAFALWSWYRGDSGSTTYDPRLPVPVQAAERMGGEFVDIEGTFTAGAGTPSSITPSWPRFRGEGFDNISRETVPLAETWPPDGPPKLWTVELGEGHGGPAVRHGRVYLLDYDDQIPGDVLRCLSLDDGREIWRRGYRVRIKQNHGVSRTVPAVSDRFCVTLGPKGQVLCVEAETGRFLWGLDLVRDYETEVPLWYTAQCPLIDGDRVILAPAGRALMLAVDAPTGRVLWETPNSLGWNMSHSSIIPMTIDGVRMYVYAAVGGLAAVAADGEKAGALLWSTDAWAPTVMAPSPVPMENGRFFVTAGYGVGSAMFQVTSSNGVFRAEATARWDKRFFGSEQQTPIYAQGLLYAILPNDAGAHRREFVCMDPNDGAVRWTSGESARFGLGPYLLADGKFFILRDEGTLVLARAQADRYEPLAEARVLDGRDAWGPLALVDGRLLLRDATRLVCLDVRASALPSPSR